MVQLEYKYAKCSECGRENFMWGAQIVGDIFICHECIVHIDEKLDDMEEAARGKAMAGRGTDAEWNPDNSQVCSIEDSLKEAKKKRQR